MRRNARKGSQAKGQVSLEFLVLIAAFLSFLAVWASLILSVKVGIEKNLLAATLAGIASDLQQGADSVCLMGEGNVLEVEVRGDAKVELLDKAVVVSKDSLQARRELRCKASEAEFSVSKRNVISLENNEGTVFAKIK
jgi:hypothetical protein